MKTVEVAAAIIIKDGKCLATQRGYGEFEGGWEFPGGKIEKGEKVIFIHTGGMPGLYTPHHRTEFEKELMDGVHVL